MVASQDSSKPTEVDLERLERELRALLPVALSLGYQDRLSPIQLSDKVVHVVMTCARLSVNK